MGLEHRSPIEHDPEWGPWSKVKEKDGIRWRERKCKVPHCTYVDKQHLGGKIQK